ncbi:MAG: GntR family transcriptional regulator [Acetobacteraceae bacterium]|nr:GntR family transcriptional regulator [Acetobacteraceae bacterium]
MRTTQHRPVAAQPTPRERRRGAQALAAGKPVAPEVVKPGAHPPSSPDLIFREIVQGLYDGTYVPGQRLVEVDLTQRWGVSRGTVREALNRLAAEGIVTLNRHRGAAIRVLDRQEMQDILAVLEMMIGMAARLAAQRVADGVNRARFTEAFEALLSFRNRPDSFELLQARNRFYRTLSIVGGNKELHGLMSRMHVHLLRVQLRALHAGLVADRFEDYARIGDAVLAGDARRAEAAARRHVRAMSEVLNAVPT